MSDTTKVDRPERQLSAEQFERLAAYGSPAEVTTGDELYSTGDVGYDLILLTTAHVEIVRDATSVEPEAVMSEFGPGSFLGELSLLTGQVAFLTARVRTPGGVVRVDAADFRRVMIEQPDISDVLLTVFASRRERLKSEAGAALEIFGTTDSPAARDIRTYVARLSVPHVWFEAESIAGEAALHARGLELSDLPAAVLAGRTLSNTTAGELAEALGFTYQETQHEVDLVVVGAGPAGLAAAVYAASEGLVTVLLDAASPGGQAARSSRIENYLGFPQGISGEALARKAMIQALKFGAQLFAPCRVVQLAQCETNLALQLSDGSEIHTHAVVVATGAEYGRLDVPRWDEFEAAGDIHFAATDLDARACASQPVVVVGGANSAGQAAMFLASMGSHVDLVIRSRDLGARMSAYLVERVLAHPLIEVHTNTTVAALAGGPHLQRVQLQQDGTLNEVEARALFCFIGATPSTSWLPETVFRDEHGFVLTDRALGDGSQLPFETSLPGVFVAGDARAGSQKRVATAVGDGASAIASVHARLALQEPARAR